jgi:hypothetical protein
MNAKQRTLVVYSALALLTMMAIWTVVGTVANLPFSRIRPKGQLVFDITWDLFLIVVAILFLGCSQGKVNGKTRAVITVVSSLLLVGTGLVISVFLLSLASPLLPLGLIFVVIGGLLPWALRETRH